MQQVALAVVKLFSCFNPERSVVDMKESNTNKFWRYYKQKYLLSVDHCLCVGVGGTRSAQT